MKKSLGRGLDALLPSFPQGDLFPEGLNADGLSPRGAAQTQSGLPTAVELDIGVVEPNPGQPRRGFDESAIRFLADSIAAVGVIQPIIVTDEGGYYRIIAGERRWRAARLAGLETIPAVIRNYSDEQMVEVALVENLQREDLNPIEEAGGYERLMTEYGYTQERIARAVGKSRPAIANAIRLLGLSQRVRDMLISGAVSIGHARALLALDSDERREAVADLVVEKGLNVRQTETIVNRQAAALSKQKQGAIPGNATGGGTGGTGATGDNIGDASASADGASVFADGASKLSGGANVIDGANAFERGAVIKKIEDALRSLLNTRVLLDESRDKTGKIIIEYYSDDDLSRLLDQFGLGGKI